MQCPSCGGRQDAGLLCADCCAIVETMLAAVPQLVDQLEVAISRQARIGGGKSGQGTARERMPVNFGAMAVRDALLVQAAIVGPDINELRRHVQAAELVRDLGSAVRDAYRAIDRAQERVYLGKCYNVVETETCYAELWARPNAKELVCKACSYEHNVANRRFDMMAMAEDQICTVKEASSYLGEIGHIRVTEASIRGYIHRKRLSYRVGTTMIRLGDLLELVVEESGRRSA
jgi:hypothetical protein